MTITELLENFTLPEITDEPPTPSPGKGIVTLFNNVSSICYKAANFASSYFSPPAPVSFLPLPSELYYCGLNRKVILVNQCDQIVEIFSRGFGGKLDWKNIFLHNKSRVIGTDTISNTLLVFDDADLLEGFIKTQEGLRPFYQQYITILQKTQGRDYFSFHIPFGDGTRADFLFEANRYLVKNFGTSKSTKIYSITR
jgi:hypothetical protein